MQINHRKQLVDLMRFRHLPMTAAEVGVAEGLFSKDLLDAGLDKLTMIDNWAHIPDTRGDGNSPQEWHDSNYEAAMERIHDYMNKGKVTVLRGLSHEMAKEVPNESLGMVYLDANHSYESVLQDLKSWWPTLAQGGIMAGHDFLATQYGVKTAVEQFCDNFCQVHIIQENNLNDASFYVIKP